MHVDAQIVAGAIPGHPIGILAAGERYLHYFGEVGPETVVDLLVDHCRRNRIFQFSDGLLHFLLARVEISSDDLGDVLSVLI